MANRNGYYDYLTIEDVIKAYEIHGDRPIIHNGHILGFTREEDNTELAIKNKNIFKY